MSLRIEQCAIISIHMPEIMQQRATFSTPVDDKNCPIWSQKTDLTTEYSIVDCGKLRDTNRGPEDGAIHHNLTRLIDTPTNTTGYTGRNEKTVHLFISIT